MVDLKKNLKELLELKNIITEMKGLNTREDLTEPRIIKLGERSREITQNVAERERKYEREVETHGMLGKVHPFGIQ